MFDADDDFLETWCPVCDKRIPQVRVRSTSTVASRKASAAGGGVVAAPVKKGPPGKFITPIAPTFRRSKTGTIKVSIQVGRSDGTWDIDQAASARAGPGLNQSWTGGKKGKQGGASRP